MPSCFLFFYFHYSLRSFRWLFDTLSHFSFSGTLVPMWEESKLHQCSQTRGRCGLGTSFPQGILSEGRGGCPRWQVSLRGRWRLSRLCSIGRWARISSPSCSAHAVPRRVGIQWVWSLDNTRGTRGWGRERAEARAPALGLQAWAPREHCCLSLRVRVLMVFRVATGPPGHP